MQCRCALLILLGSFCLAGLAQEAALTGHVMNAQTDRAIENLTVVLIAPASMSVPKRVTTTDQNGSFNFSKLIPGKYLLEVSEGPRLLYRKQIEVPSLSPIEIALQPNR